MTEFFSNCQNGTIFNRITLFSETLILEPHTYVVYVTFFSSVLILTQVKTKGCYYLFVKTIQTILTPKLRLMSSINNTPQLISEFQATFEFKVRLTHVDCGV